MTGTCTRCPWSGTLPVTTVLSMAAHGGCGVPICSSGAPLVRPAPTMCRCNRQPL